jgi:hypothetical protein
MPPYFARANASCDLPQNPIRGGREIVRNKLRRRGPRLRLLRKLSFSIARANENAAGTSAVSRFDITIAISDNEGTPQVEAMLASGTLQQSRVWLPALAAVLRSMRAVVNCIQMRPGGGELLRQELMYGVHLQFREVPSSDPRLIGHHDYRQPHFIQAANSSRDKGKHTKTAGILQVTNFFGDRSVAVEKNRRTRRGGFRQSAPPPTRAKNARQLRPQLARRASCTGDRWDTAGESTDCNRASPARWRSAA